MARFYSTNFLLALVVVIVLISLCPWAAVSVWQEPTGYSYVDPIDRDGPWSTIQLSVVVDARREECFHQRVKQDFVFQLQYHIASRDVHPNFKVTITTDRNKRLYTSLVLLEDKFVKDVDQDGVYNICFSNHASRFHSRKVSMTVDLREETRVKKFFELKQETESHLGNVSASLQTTWRYVRRINGNQFMMRYYTQRDTELQLSNADYIMYWSFAQALVIVGCGIVQVCVLRSFFNAKVLTPSQKPRC